MEDQDRTVGKDERDDDVEGHVSQKHKDAPALAKDEGDDDVEAHMHKHAHKHAHKH
jgi:hypothetical protein